MAVAGRTGPEIPELAWPSSTSRELWERIVAALRNAGVEMLPEGRGHGAGVRWMWQRGDRILLPEPRVPEPRD